MAGTLSFGGAPGAPGTLTINGKLSLDDGSRLAYRFGQAGVVGGPLNDLTIVKGDLVLGGTLNVVTSPGGRFDPGVYRVISYGGTLTDKSLAIGTIPAPSFAPDGRGRADQPGPHGRLEPERSGTGQPRPTKTMAGSTAAMAIGSTPRATTTGPTRWARSTRPMATALSPFSWRRPAR